MVRKVIGCAVVLSMVLLARPANANGVPANDNFANAEVIAGTSGSTSGTNGTATVEAGEPAHANGPTGPFKSVWYSWVAPGNGSASFQTCMSDFDTSIAAYTGTAVNALSQVASNDDSTGCPDRSQMAFSVESGVTYSIAVDGFNGASGNIALDWGFAPAPANDDFANAQMITGPSGALKSTNAAATAEVDEPNPSFYEDGPSHSVWYAWTAPVDTLMEFAVSSEAFDPSFAVYQGNAVDDLLLIASQDPETGSLSVRFHASSGEVYLVQIDGNEMGAFKLTWEEPDYQPDAKVKKSTDAQFTGSNQYDFNQYVESRIKRGKTLTFDLSFENDGAVVDTFTLSGFCGGQGYKFKFFDGPTDVTNDVQFLGYVTPPLASGASKALTMRVTATKSAKKFGGCTVDAYSNGGFAFDEVSASVRVS